MNTSKNKIKEYVMRKPELVAAIATRDISKAFEIVHFFSKNPKEHPVQMITGILFNFVNNLIQYHSLKGKNEKKF